MLPEIQATDKVFARDKEKVNRSKKEKFPRVVSHRAPPHPSVTSHCLVRTGLGSSEPLTSPGSAAEAGEARGPIHAGHAQVSEWSAMSRDSPKASLWMGRTGGGLQGCRACPCVLLWGHHKPVRLLQASAEWASCTLFFPPGPALRALALSRHT